MRVLFATDHTYPPQRVGGSESSTHDLCLALQDRAVEVAVLSRLSWWHPISARRPRQALAWVGRRRVRDEASGYPVFRAREPVLEVARLVRELRPSVAVIQAGRPLRLADRCAALGTPTVVYLRDAFFDDLGGTVRDRAGIRYVTTSGYLARRFAEAFGIVPEPIPPLIRPERYRVEPRGRNVTFVCPMPLKGLEIALDLARRRPDIPFVFLESWPLDSPRWRSLKRRIRGAGNIALRRWTEDMRSVYREAKIVLVPSLCEEGWSRVVSEAQLSGIPALASDRGGLPESVGDGGILIDPYRGIEAWAHALSRMWDDAVEYERLAGLALRHARRPELEPETIAAQLLAILSDTVSDPPKNDGQ